MNKFILIMALTVSMPMAALADNTAISGSAAGAISNSGANSAALQGNQQGVTINGGDVPDHLRTVPAIVAPGLVASYVECFGSASGGVSVMGFGVTLGKTYTDTDCQHRRDANSAVALGEVAVGYQVMCQNASFFKADQATKKACKIAPDGMAPEVQPLPAETSKATKVDPVSERSVDDILAANRSEVAFLAR
jgi:hypothetical protein